MPYVQPGGGGGRQLWIIGKLWVGIWEKSPVLGTEAEGRTNQLLSLDQKHAWQEPLTASNRKMTQLYFFCYPKEFRVSMAWRIDLPERNERTSTNNTNFTHVPETEWGSYGACEVGNRGAQRSRWLWNKPDPSFTGQETKAGRWERSFAWSQCKALSERDFSFGFPHAHLPQSQLAAST